MEFFLCQREQVIDGIFKTATICTCTFIVQKKKISIHTNKILTVKSSEEYVPLNHRGAEGCLYSVNWVQMCTTVMNWLEMLVCIRQEIEGIVWNYVISPALRRPLDFCRKAGDLSFFFFLSLNHVAIACYLWALVKNLTLQTIGGNVSRLMKLTCPDPKKEKVKVKPDQPRNYPYNVPEPYSLSGCPTLFSFFF